MSLENAIKSLQEGEFILLHDSGKRENEVDMVVAGQFVTPEHVARMRLNAGGLLCIALNDGLAKKLNLQYMHNILSESPSCDSSFKKMIMGNAPYGDHPTFSISVNHNLTFTGITDKDRALTINEMARLYNVENPKRHFTSSFKTPGHIPLLLASPGLLATRKGHTKCQYFF